MQKKPQEMTVKQLASKFDKEKNLLSREEHFSFSSEYKLLTKCCYMLNSNLVNIYSFALVRTSKHLLPNCNTQQPKDRYHGRSR